MMAPSKRALLIEDEPHARRYLRELLIGDPHVIVVGEACNGVEGAELIRVLSPDLVFLDIQMPEADGFDLIARVWADDGARPAFIFVTAHCEYAVRAFEVDAVDYLCKPFGRERLSAAVDRAIRYLRARDAIQATAAAADANAKTSPAAPAAGSAARAVPVAPAAVAAGAVSDGSPLARIAIKDDEEITFVAVDEIIWIEAANKYVVIHTPARKHVARQTIQALVRQLDPTQFVRIHRSILVRKSAVRGLQPLFHGDYVLRLTNGQELTLSRTFRDAFFEAMSR